MYSKQNARGVHCRDKEQHELPFMGSEVRGGASPGWSRGLVASESLSIEMHTVK